VLTILIFGCNPAIMTTLPKPLGKITKSEIINNYLDSNSLDFVEGIWSWDDNQYEVAIIKNKTNTYSQYDYIGIITETRNKGWVVGEIKLLLKKTVSEYVYSVIYYMGDKSETGSTLTMPNENMIEMMLPTGENYAKEKVILIKSYPSNKKEIFKSNESINISGTGFFISNDVIATNYHVVAEAKEIKINLNQNYYNARLLIKDATNDLALLQISFKDSPIERKMFLEQVKPLPIGRVNNIKEGDKVFTIGFPLSQELGKSPRVSEGIINSTYGMEDDPRMFQVSIPVQPGNSGGPMFNQFGEVVGIITSTINNAYLIMKKGTFSQNVNFAVKINYLNNLLELLPEKIEPTKRQDMNQKTISEFVELYKKSVVLIEVKQ
jgi:serine protease Do